jgi:hypothetical protein
VRTLGAPAKEAGETCITRSFTIDIFRFVYFGVYIKDEMGGTLLRLKGT